MSTHEYKPGDLVIVYQEGKPIKSGTVATVQPYKPGPKVVLADGTEWDPAVDRMWGCRSDRWYHGQSISPWTKDGAADLLNRLRKAAVDWVAANWSTLTDEQRVAIGDLARTIRKAAKS